MSPHIHTFHDVEMTRVWLEFIFNMSAALVLSYGFYRLFKHISES